MADITLAEYDGQMWLVGGTDYLDGLLSNRLPEGKTIEIIPCEVHAEVHELWRQYSGEADNNDDRGIIGTPWQIHPNIIARIKRSALGFLVLFEEWSAKVDPESLKVIAAAASEMRDRPEEPVIVVAYDEPGVAGAALAISDLRMQMVVDRLVAEGLDAGRISRDRRDPATAAEGVPTKDRVDIIMPGAG